MAPEQPPEPKRPRHLSQRLILSVGGAALAGMGAVATFATQNQAGTAGLLGIGGLLFLIGVKDLTLQRLKLGDNEAEFKETVGERVIEAAASVTAIPSPTQKAALDFVEQVAEERGINVPPAIERRITEFEYLSAVFDALKPLGNIDTVEIHGPDMIVDGLPVETMYRPPSSSTITTAGFRRRVEERLDFLLRMGHTKLLVVTNIRAAISIQTSQRNSITYDKARALPVYWTPDMDPEVLRAAVKRFR